MQGFPASRLVPRPPCLLHPSSFVPLSFTAPVSMPPENYPRKSWLRFFGRTEFGLLLANIAVYSAVLFLDPQRNFKNPLSLQLLTTEAALLGIFAIGSAVVIIAGGIDLSGGSGIGLTGGGGAFARGLLA